MADLLGIGTSGLMAYQRALTTTSHNISNVNTEGYSRQRTEFATRIPEFVGMGYAGTGVNVTSISRNFDQFLATQLRTQTANNERHSAFYTLSSQIDNLLADPNAGLGPMMDEFFGAVQGVADSPNSIPARQVLLTSAESLEDRFHYLEKHLTDLNSRSNQQIDAAVYEINSLARSIAHANDEIAKARGASFGSEPNDLLDRRDLMLSKLSELIDVKTVEQTDGTMNVFVGTGQGLVVGNTATGLHVRKDSMVQDRVRIMLEDSSDGVEVAHLLKGGKLGGTLEFRENVLDETRNALGRIAVALTVELNQVHQQGVDLNGLPGDYFFRPLEPSVFPGNNTPGIGSPVVGYGDLSALTTNDYMLEYTGGAWQMTDFKTSKVLGTFSPDASGEFSVIERHGITIDLNTVNDPNEGDQFLIRPTISAAYQFATAVGDPTRIAAAMALRVGEGVDSTSRPSNLGSGAIGNVTSLNPEFLPLDEPITLTYGGVQVGGAVNISLNDTRAYNQQRPEEFDYSGVENHAQFDVLDAAVPGGRIGITLSADYNDSDGLATEIQAQLQAVDNNYRVSVESGSLVISKDGNSEPITLAELDQNALNAGFVAGSGAAGGDGVSPAEFELDGIALSVATEYDAVLDDPQDIYNIIEAELQAQLDAQYPLLHGESNPYTVTIDADGNVSFNGADATLSNPNGAVSLSSLNDGDGEWQQAFEIGGLGSHPVEPLRYDPDTDAGKTFLLVRGTIDADNDEYYYRFVREDAVQGIADDEVAMMGLTMSGRPHDGDTFHVENSAGAVGDNRNMLAMAELQNQKGLLGGTSSFQTAYGQMVSRVGTQTHQAGINQDATATLRNQAESAYQAVSGVNLDEEAANLIKFQQGYQANAQVISAANRMFQVLLDAF